MADQSYPSDLTQIETWAKNNHVSTLEARTRFMEFVILNCIAFYQPTRNGMVLKGGNALRFAYQSPRSTKDLDFTAAGDGMPDNADAIRDLMNAAMSYAHRRFGVKAKCQSVTRKPKNPDRTLPTFEVKIGYQFPNDRYFHNFESRNFPTVIPLEITLNDLVCATAAWSGVAGLRVCSLEDILAEKLRSLLQQIIRNRNRCQDVYDICRYTRRSDIDREKIAEYLQRKSSIRDIEVRKSSFNDEVRSRAAAEYEVRVMKQAPRDFIPFDEAWEEVMQLVLSLNIPD